MVDTLDVAQRSERMARIKGKHTRPEMLVRKLVHGMGFRYRLHGKDLPGHPDLVFRKRRCAIFVHGCFWHRHGNPDCKRARLPKSRLDFWLPKLEENERRDQLVLRELGELGWKTLVIWECELADHASLETRIRAFLTP
ncbi:MAG: DNA mismatch endonuclease Vsr [Desulfovibrio sp.]|jgi:DNA mismatch endonuclease (patch repair protein)|nr:DNA mismatch endonuclease Vsr [Desulfovibrio sp.]